MKFRRKAEHKSVGAMEPCDDDWKWVWFRPSSADPTVVGGRDYVLCIFFRSAAIWQGFALLVLRAWQLTVSNNTRGFIRYTKLKDIHRTMTVRRSSVCVGCCFSFRKIAIGSQFCLELKSGAEVWFYFPANLLRSRWRNQRFTLEKV